MSSEHWAEVQRELRNAGDALERASRAVLRAAADDAQIGSFQQSGDLGAVGVQPTLQQAAGFADRLATAAADHQAQAAAGFNFTEEAAA